MIALCNLFQLLSVLTTLPYSDAFLFNSRYQQKPGHSVAHFRQKSSFDNLLHSSSSEVENVPVTLPESDESQLWKPDSTPHDFDISLAVILAGYSFEAYNEPSVLGKIAYGLDGTNITFTSSEYVQRVFSGALVVTLRQGQFKLKEEGFVESVLTGSDPDPYVIVSVLENEIREPKKETIRSRIMKVFGDKEPKSKVKKQSSFMRVLDSAKSDRKDNNAAPVWDQSFYLYVKDPESAALTFRAMDKDLFKEDDLLGLGAISVKELISMNADGDVMDGVPVPLYIDPAEQKELERSKELAKKNGVSKEAYAKSTAQTVLSIFNLNNLFGRNKLKRTGTLKVDVQFIPWLPPSKDRVLSGPAVLDFSLSKDGITQTLAKDLELQFRRLPKGASPGVLDWAELTSQLKTRFKSNKKLKLKLKPREAVSPASSQTYDMVVDVNKEGENNPDKERKIMIEPGETGENVKKSKEFVDLMDTVTTTNKLINKAEEMKDAVVGFVEKKMEGNDDDSDEPGERHHRLSCGIIEGFNLSQICSLDNAETDTQASVWADFNKKQVIISFRGTEQVKFKDILTDINLVQHPYDAGNPVMAELTVHKGFMDAFRSVRGALLQVVHSLLILPPSVLAEDYGIKIDENEDENGDDGEKKEEKKAVKVDTSNIADHWHIYVTGHSLGGALATLFTFELGRIRAGLYGLSMEQNAANPTEIPVDPASVYEEDDVFLTALRNADLTMYSYGAPRTGSPAFTKKFNEFVTDGFRIVNNKDIVPRIPRSSKTSRFLQYEHVGRTVMIRTDVDSAVSPEGPTPMILWVQGEGNSSEPCPISDISPFQESSIFSDSSPSTILRIANETYTTGENLKREAIGFFKEKAADFANTFSDQMDNGQAMQQELLEQFKSTVGEDAMNAVASTSADANKLFNDGIELATQQYNQSNMTKFISDSVGNFNPFFPPLPFGTPFPTLFPTSESSTAASAAQSITQDPTSTSTSTSTSTLASTQEPPQDDLTAQFMSIAYQATGLSAAGLSQLLSVGDTVNEFHLMATDISKGLTPEFIKREKELFAAILDGKAIEDHLEPSYFKAISKAVLSALDIQDSEEEKDDQKDA